MKTSLISLATVVVLAVAPAASAQITPATNDYIYDAQPLGSDTQSCVAVGPGGTFVGIGPGFTANAQSVVFVRESGVLHLVASGFSSIGDCAYDAANDVLYVTDNADNADLGITTSFGNTGAQSGDTVFAIPGASTAGGLLAPDLELLPADSIGTPASVTFDSAGNVFVGDSAGGGVGEVGKIAPGPVASTFAGGFDFTGGLAVEPVSGDLFVAENLATFDNQITRFDSAGATVGPVPFAGPGTGFGSYDLAFNTDGRMLATGLFGGDVVSFDLLGGSTPFAQGMTFATGASVNPFTERVEILSSTFSGAAEDKSIHRFVRRDTLVPGTGSPKTECIHEFYGIELVGKDAECVDGQPCDADGKVDDRCSFPLGFCFNVDDPSFPDCTPAAGVTSVSVTTSPHSEPVAVALASVLAALPVSGPSCFFSDGYVVPVKVKSSGLKKDGKAKVKLKSETNDGRKDNDAVKLVCRPAP